MIALMLLGLAPIPLVVTPPRVRADSAQRVAEMRLIRRLITREPGLTRLQIAERLCIAPHTVKLRLTELRRSRLVTIDRDANGCYWYPLNEDETA